MGCVGGHLPSTVIQLIQMENKYPIVSDTRGVDAIVEHILVDNPDFRDLDYLTDQIESETLKFIMDVESFLTKL